MRAGDSSSVVKLGAFAFLILLIGVVAFAGRAGPVALVLAAISIGVMAAHAVAALGAVEAAAFVVITLIVSFAIENLGVATGVPFGHYAFRVGASLPHVGRIPLIVGALYVGVGYPSWIIANLVVTGQVDRPRGLDLFAVPALAAFVMVQWDAVMDPGRSTLTRDWVWYGHGGYFGVPLSNFLGWFLTTYLYCQLFAAFLHLRRGAPDYRGRSPLFWSVPVLLYLAAGLCHVPPLLDADASLTDGMGHTWSATDLRQTAVVVMLVTMLPSALLALVALARSRAGRGADRGR